MADGPHPPALPHRGASSSLSFSGLLGRWPFHPCHLTTTQHRACFVSRQQQREFQVDKALEMLHTALAWRGSRCVYACIPRGRWLLADPRAHPTTPTGSRTRCGRAWRRCSSRGRRARSTTRARTAGAGERASERGPCPGPCVLTGLTTLPCHKHKPNSPVVIFNNSVNNSNDPRAQMRYLAFNLETALRKARVSELQRPTSPPRPQTSDAHRPSFPSPHARRPTARPT